MATGVSVWERRKRNLHEAALYPTIRVSSDRSTGSGTIIASIPRTEPDEDGEMGHNTYALTNWHVVSEAIRVEKEYDPVKGRYITKDYRDLVKVEVFSYKNLSTITSRTTAEAEILAYSEPRDIALLRLKTNQRFEHIAKVFEAKQSKNIHIFDPILVVGCGLGQPPFPTQGTLTGKEHVIDYQPYWMGNAPAIFGNSGGAVFLERTLEFIGIPSRIAVTGGMFARSPATHFMYFIPPAEVAKFVKDNGYHFLVDDTHNEADDLKALKERASKERNKPKEDGEDA